jgi:SAM-dependent methyltransferase
VDQPDVGRLAEIYNQSYYEAWEWERRGVVQAAKARTMLQALRVTEPRPGARLLDVGCAQGEFAAAALALGLRVSGVDLNPDAVRRARERVPQATFYCGELQPQVVGSNWDMITMFDLIEHVRDPIGTLRQAASVLAPTGRLVIATPATDSMVHRLCGRFWPQYREEHLVLFSSLGMQEALSAAGFEVEVITPRTKYTTGAYLLGQLAAYSPPGLQRITRLLRWALHMPPMHWLLPLRFGEMTIVARPLGQS